MDHRHAAEELTARALTVMIHALDRNRDFTPDEVEEVLYCLTAAAVKIKKLPGGKEAAERLLAKAQAEQERRKQGVCTSTANTDS